MGEIIALSNDSLPTEVLAPEGPIEQLARHLHWHMERLEPTDEPEWDSLSNFQKEFYRLCVEGILELRSTIERALALTDNNNVFRRPQLGE